MKPEKTIVLVTDRHLLPAREGSRARIVQLIRALRKAGFAVVLLTLRTPGHFNGALPALRATFKLRLLVDRLVTVEASYFHFGSPSAYDCTPFRAALRDCVQRFRPAAVIAEYLWIAPCLDVVPSETLRMVDTHDLMHVRSRLFSGQPEGAWVECSRTEEQKLLRHADVIIAIQRHELEQFREMLPEKQVICVPHAVPVRRKLLARPRRDGAKVVFIGSRIQGNLVGLQSFIETAWPLILAGHPTAELEIYGDVADRIEAEGKNIRKVGFVEDLSQVYRTATVVINPVALGTGLKIKTIEAVAHGKALVTTSCGAAGIEEYERQPFIVEDDMRRFGEAVLRLLRDDPFRSQIERAALQLAQQRFSSGAAIAQLVDVLTSPARKTVSSGSVPESVQVSPRSLTASSLARAGDHT